MVIFGGLFELTKELNDLHVFDLKNLQWIKVFDESEAPYSPMRLPQSSMGDNSNRDLGFSERDSKKPLINPIVQDSPYVINEESQENDSLHA